MSKPKPTGVTADRTAGEVIITWNDGQECRYPFAGLRAICPCVECKGGHANMGGPPDVEKLHNTQNSELKLENVTPVGSYALQFQWSDGHVNGIYTWDYLRHACGP